MDKVNILSSPRGPCTGSRTQSPQANQLHDCIDCANYRKQQDDFRLDLAYLGYNFSDNEYPVDTLEGSGARWEQLESELEFAASTSDRMPSRNSLVAQLQAFETRARAHNAGPYEGQ